MNASQLYDSLGPLTVGDEERGWPLLRFCEVLCSTTDPIDLLVSDASDLPGWGLLFDVDACPVEALPYLAQFVGVSIDPAWSEAETRAAIRSPEGFSRGTPAVIVEKAKRTLTGAKTVLMDERYMDNAYRLRVRTFASETPSPALTEAEIRRQKPIGIVLTYAAITGLDWADVIDEYDDWDAVVAEHSTWTELMSTLP